MKPFSSSIYQHLESLPGMDVDAIKKAMKIRQIHDMWRDLVEQMILDHTNSVFLFTKNGKKEFHVYMDSSIYAAELNNRRELLKMLAHERFNEDIDIFEIHISRGVHKKEYPFQISQEEGVSLHQDKVVELPERMIRDIEDSAYKIPHEALRKAFTSAMKSDLEWKAQEQRKHTRDTDYNGIK